MDYQEWSRKLNPDKNGMCYCPAHQDKKRSLKLTDGKDRALIKCFAGCSTESIVEAAGCKMSDLFYSSGSGGGGDPDDKWMRYVESRTKKQVEAVYHHTDTDGNYICTKVRLRPKDFRYGILKDGRFAFGLGGKKRKSIKAFYCKDLTKLKKAAADGKIVFVAEGEKDIDALYTHGLLGLSCGGVNDWCKGVADVLQGAAVVILADNDQPGIKVAKQIEQDLKGIAKSVKVVIPTPDIPHGDVSDYLKDHTPKELKALINKADENKPPLKVQKQILTEADAIILSNSKPLDLQLTEKGKVASSFINYCDILDNDSYLHDKMGFNLMSNRPVIKGVFWNLEEHDIDDTDYGQIRRYVSNLYGIHNKNDIIQAVNLSAGNNLFHPIRDLLNGLEWDGISRIDNLFPRYLGAEKSDYTAGITRLLFSGLVMRVFYPGCKFDVCVILADKRQGTGKSTMCRLLALNDDWFTDEIESLDNKKDSFECLSGRWVAELAEMMATKKTKEIETIKAFITRKTDTYRTPYGITAKDYKRQVVFIGTTNRPEFLPADKTGNRRFLPVLLDGDRAERHPLEDEQETRGYILQCYAEIMDMMRKQGRLSLTIPLSIAEQVKELQEQGTPEDSRIGMIQEFLDNYQDNTVCTRLIWDKVFAGDAERPPKKIDLAELADIMNLSIVGWEKYRGKHGDSKTGKYRFPSPYGSQRAWQKIVSRGAVSVDTKTGTGGHKSKDSEGFMEIPDDEELPFS